MKLIEYFRADLLEKVTQGSMRFGTLREYRMGENEVSPVDERFSDTLEGIDQIGVKSWVSTDEPVELPGLYVKGGGVVLDRITITNEIFANVFCCSIGPYDEKHHRMMVHGRRFANSPSYAGNSDLTHFAEYDSELLHQALDSLHPQNADPVQKVAQLAVDSAPVSYGEKSFRMLHTELVGVDQNYASAVWAVFQKPTRFSVEREFRMVLRSFKSQSIERRSDAAYVKSPMIANAIVRVGEISF